MEHIALFFALNESTAQKKSTYVWSREKRVPNLNVSNANSCNTQDKQNTYILNADVKDIKPDDNTFVYIMSFWFITDIRFLVAILWLSTFAEYFYLFSEKWLLFSFSSGSVEMFCCHCYSFMWFNLGDGKLSAFGLDQFQYVGFCVNCYCSLGHKLQPKREAYCGLCKFFVEFQ